MHEIWRAIIDYASPEWPQVKSDLCLVFGTRTGEEQFALEIHRRLKSGHFDRVVLSGGATHGKALTEADILCNLLMDLGIERDRLILEKKATNTLENVLFSKSIVETEGLQPKTLSIIGKVSSMRRYAMTVQRNWPEVAVVSAHPVNIFNVERSAWFEDTDFRDRVFGELKRIVEYQKRDHIAEITLEKR